MSQNRALEISFHGKIIDHLGIQMYQSAVAALAEMVSNSWDADAENVLIYIPDKIGPGSEIHILDDGFGMTFEDCQHKFLKVGLNRRGKDREAKSIGKKRPILGRKGIGKLAGFGIAKKIEIDTVSKENGERTKFCLDLEELRGADYIGKDPKLIKVLEYEGPSSKRKQKHGTSIVLKDLILKKKPDNFSERMSRRFLLAQTSSDFKVFVNDVPLPTNSIFKDVEFQFPRDFDTTDKKPELEMTGDWATEIIPDGNIVKWKVNFFSKPISEEDLRGITIFANGKLAQTPFMFNLTGGLVTQHGLEYISGQVQADFVDALIEDVIAPERQRINWEHPDTEALLLWGQNFIKMLLTNWKSRRVAEKKKILVEKVNHFSQRIDALEKSEQKIITQALDKIASIDAIDNEQFEYLGDSLLTAWEGGKLKELINQVAELEVMDEQDLLRILIEAKVLNALHTAEAVKTKLAVIAGLQERIDKKDLENSIRNYIANNPWLIGPKWETFKTETSLKKLTSEWDSIVEKSYGKQTNKRVDLVLSSGEQLLIVEFMQPGLPLDRDHLDRFEFYIQTVESSLKSNTKSRFKRVSGYIVADKIDKNPANLLKINEIEKKDMYAMDWATLFTEAYATWEEFLIVLSERAPEDARMKKLLEGIK